ncbi:MAG: hypothetical protein JW727_06555 [Candidatus Aenigmarchaeota archaeon]|nr:hypothetical protein [Candidatus Aenigmarchaeota archaeon]
MDTADLKALVKSIVVKANTLKNKHTSEKEAFVNYACIFSQSKEKYEELLEAAGKMGKIIKETPTGPLFHIEPLETGSGTLRILKIRAPDLTRPEEGDADFTVSGFSAFQEKYLTRPGFKLIEREKFVMIELMDPTFSVRAYFSNPPLDRQLNIG